MRVLQICNKPPIPAVDGGCIAMNNVTKGLLDQGHEVQILTICTKKHPFREDELSDLYKEKTLIQGVFVDTKVNFVDAFSNLVTSDSYNVSRFFSPDFDLRLISILRKKKFDVVHLESLFMTPYIHSIRRFSKAKVILRSHNLEYMIWERQAEGAKNPAKKIYISMLARQLKKYELKIMNEVDGIAAISRQDADKYLGFGCTTPMQISPFGIDMEEHDSIAKKAPQNTVFHIGAMDWKPNLEGLGWFKSEVWPSIKNVELHLAGRNMPSWFMEENDTSIINHGEVESAKDFMDDHAIMIVPILSAGGMRVKIIEGMARRKAIISTTIGAEGISCTHGKDIIIADTKEEMIEAINKLIGDPELVKEIGNNARKLVEDRYDNMQIIKDLVEFYKGLD
ncbi:MAG: glycosyl transferase family 4 [Thalassobium sp.]|nr:MAG: glycosyl transferase family 4 [Thalassobium sp.]